MGSPYLFKILKGVFKDFWGFQSFVVCFTVFFNIFVIWGGSWGFPSKDFDNSLHDFGGGGRDPKVSRELGGFWKIEQVFGRSFGLLRILGHFKGCPLDFGGFHRIPGISQDCRGFYQMLLIHIHSRC